MTEEATTEVAEAPDAAPVENIETEARKMGWRPKDEYKGNPDLWREADEFVQRGREILPIVRANNEKLEANNEKLAKEIRELRQTITEQKEWNTRAERLSYERAIKDVEARQREAVTLGDVEAFDKARDDLKAINKEVETKPEVQANPADDPVLNAWIGENKWYGTDSELTEESIVVAEIVRRRNPNLAGAEFLNEVAKRVRAAHPDKFEDKTNPKRSAPPAVEGPTRPAPKGGKTFADLPAEAKAQCDRFIKNGVLKTREEYARNYEW